MDKAWCEGINDAIIVKYVKIDGHSFENPVPRFEYEVKIGTWFIIVETVRHINFFAARENQDVEVEVGMPFGTLRDKGRVSVWRGGLDDAPSFRAIVKGSDPMHFVER